MIHGAGGWTSLAHPGYYQRDGYAVAERLPVLRGLGLDGVELDYPYHACSPHQWSLEQVHMETFSVPGETLLGSDSHTPEDFERVYGRA